jgi:hypothetical protein
MVDLKTYEFKNGQGLCPELSYIINFFVAIPLTNLARPNGLDMNK